MVANITVPLQSAHMLVQDGGVVSDGQGGPPTPSFLIVCAISALTVHPESAVLTWKHVAPGDGNTDCAQSKHDDFKPSQT